MDKSFSHIRVLNPIEQAFTISNEAAPLCVVCILHLTNGPQDEEITEALKVLQSRFVLLRSRIKKINRQYYFQELKSLTPVKLKFLKREEADSFKQYASQEVNLKFDKEGPLMRCSYVRSEAFSDSEIIITFHHAVMDSASARLILHEFLSLCGGNNLYENSKEKRIEKSELKFSAEAGINKNLAFAGRQLSNEWKYKSAGIISPIPATSENGLISFRLSATNSRRLSVESGRKGVSLNSLLLAAITKALVKFKYPDIKSSQARVLSFADARSLFESPIGDRELGCYISMLRLQIKINPKLTIWQLAKTIRGGIFQASRNAEIPIMYRISKFLVKMTLRAKRFRLSTSALSFMGILDLDKKYGPIILNDVSTYITNNKFGPEFSGFGKIFSGSIGLDFTYLTSELTASQAKAISKEIEIILLDIIKSDI